jgi:hypothetical protein
MVIYEWRDARYLGIDTEPDNYLVPVSDLVEIYTTTELTLSLENLCMHNRRSPCQTVPRGPARKVHLKPKRRTY